VVGFMTFPDSRSVERLGEMTTFRARGAPGVINPVGASPWPFDRPAGDRPDAPTPERSQPRPARARHRAQKRGWSPSLAGIVWLVAGLGLLLDGFAVAKAPAYPGLGLFLFWAAILVPFVTFMTVLLAAQPSRALRELTVAAVGVYPALLYRMASPLVLGGFDEHIHERTLLDLLRGSGLFAPNPMLPVSSHYEGLELFTGAGVRLAGLPVMLAISLVVLLCRLLLVLTIYHGALTLNLSRWGASLAVILYAASPQFYFFNSQFAYQTMALTLGLGGLFLLRRAQLAEGSAARVLFCAAILSLTATVITHHVTSWIVLAFLVVWMIFAQRGQRRMLVGAAAAMAISVIAWTAGIIHQLVVYLGPVAAAALQEWQIFVGGAGAQRRVFTGAGGTVTPDWERIVLVFYALSCSCAAVICGWALLSRALRERNRMLGLLGALCLVFPVTLAAHFVPTAADLGDRASTFLFFPLAVACALLMRPPPGVSRRILRRHNPAVLVSLMGLAAVTYMGGVMLGVGPDWNVLPGHYLVSAEARTQDPETLAAIKWARAHLPAGSRVVADRIPADLLAAQARLWPVTSPEHGLEAAWLYFAGNWGPEQTAVARGLHVSYLYVDQRLADSLPRDGFYFYPGESLTPKRITTVNLTKFSHVRGLRIIYHHGPVSIYDTAGLGISPVRQGFAGQRRMGLGRLGDAICGAALAGLALLFRRRLAWMRSAAQELGPLGIGLSAVAVLTLIGAALFGLRLMPGPAFTVGAGLTTLVALAVLRKREGRRLIPRMPFPRRLDPLVLLGILVGTAGLAIGMHAAWAVDVTAVNTILRAVGMVGSV
jgi:hypothetical protein